MKDKLLKLILGIKSNIFDKNYSAWFSFNFFVNGISTFMGYLMPKPS